MGNASRIVLKHPERFFDPFGLDYGKYIRTQAEKVTIFDVVFSKARDPEHDQKLDPGYIEALTPLVVVSHFGEYAAHRYCTTAAEAAPFPKLRDCCFYQAADERRHSEMDRARMDDWGITTERAREIWNDVTPNARRVFEFLESLSDPYQIVFLANFVFEGSAGASFFPHWAELARINGDYVTYVINRTRFSDEVRHIGYSRAVTKLIAEEDDANIAILNEWLAEFMALVGGLMGEVAVMTNDRAPTPYKSSAEWGMDGLMELGKSMGDVGLDPAVLFAAAPAEGFAGGPA